MIKQHYTGSSRQAVNVIWNAAQDYSFDPPFLAFHPNGEPDPYFNMVIGLTLKWLDRGRVTEFFERLGEGGARDEASSVLWLGIENCVYGKELPHRPVIARLREDRAKEFFRVHSALSEQQLSFMSMKVYDQEEMRWSRVLGRKVLDVGPAARKLADELEFDPGWDTDEVLARMTSILKERFRITLPEHPHTGRRAGSSWRNALGRVLGGTQQRRTDLLVLRKGSGTGDHVRAVHLTHNRGEVHTSGDPEKDRAYIETAFGSCMYSDAEMRILEGTLCRDDDAGCRLWFTAGDAAFPPQSRETSQQTQSREARQQTQNRGASQQTRSREARQLAQDQKAQRERNEEYFRKNAFRINESIRNLTAQTETVFRSCFQFMSAPADRGKLDASRIWRLPALEDGKVFLKDADPIETTVSVDLLLDASQSRMNSQEMICTQAVVISRSFEACRIPVRVTAFRSLRGYTVLQRLKDYGDRQCRGIFRYYAGGWNRDALCVKAMDYLLEEEKKQGTGRLRILLILTDANPNDSVPLPPAPGSLFSREYEGDAAVRSTEKAVRQLRSRGVRCCAVYYGSNSHLDQAHQIYGQQYARIRSLDQLPDAVSELLRRNLQAMG